MTPRLKGDGFQTGVGQRAAVSESRDEHRMPLWLRLVKHSARRQHVGPAQLHYMMVS